MRHITLAGDFESTNRTLGVAYKDTLERIIWGEALSGLPSRKNRALLRIMERRFHADFSDEYARIQALGEGAILDETRLLEMFSLELGCSFGLMPPIRTLTMGLPRHNGDPTDNSTPALGVVLDALPPLHPMASLITRRHDDEFSRIELGFVPFFGPFLGINDRGLALALSLKPTEVGGEGIVPVSLATGRALDRCSNVHDAAALLMETHRGASGIIALADKDATLVVEFTPAAAEIRTPEEEAPIIAAQHFLSPGMMSRDIPHDETYPADAPETLRYTRIFEPSERRFTAAHTCMAGKSGFTGRDLTDLLADADSGLTTDGPLYRTLACAVLLPRRTSLFLSTEENTGTFTRYGLND